MLRSLLVARGTGWSELKGTNVAQRHPILSMWFAAHAWDDCKYPEQFHPSIPTFRADFITYLANSADSRD